MHVIGKRCGRAEVRGGATWMPLLVRYDPIVYHMAYIKPPNLFLVKVDSKNLDKVIIKNTHISFINGKNLWSTTVGYVYVCICKLNLKKEKLQ